MIRALADIGNSRVKCRLLAPDGSPASMRALPTDDPDSWPSRLSAWPSVAGSSWTISSVNPQAADRLVAFLERHGATVARLFGSAADVPVPHALRTPQTTGADRALAVLAALDRHPEGGPGQVVSCGTAITVERIGTDGTWQGGAIAPGFGVMADALNRNTAQLPRVTLDSQPPPPWGDATAPALAAGIYWAVVGAIRELLARQSSENADTPPWCLWTGGDAAILAHLIEGADRRGRTGPRARRARPAGVPGTPGRFDVQVRPREPSHGNRRPARAPDLTVIRGRTARNGMNPSERKSSPRAAVLSADGRGAIAVVRVWGPTAREVADAAFRPARGRRLAETPSGRLRFGRMGAGLGDEVVAFVTVDDLPEVEIQCHGGTAAVALVLDALRDEGIRIVPAGEWVGRNARVPGDRGGRDGPGSRPHAPRGGDLARPGGGGTGARTSRGPGCDRGERRRHGDSMSRCPDRSGSTRRSSGAGLVGGSRRQAERRQEPASERAGGLREVDRRRHAGDDAATS